MVSTDSCAVQGPKPFDNQHLGTDFTCEERNENYAIHALQEAIKAHEGFITAQHEQYRFILPLMRLLAEGKPVEPRHLATMAHGSLEEIQAVVPSSDVEGAASLGRSLARRILAFEQESDNHEYSI